VLGLDLICSKVGTHMAKWEPKSIFRYSLLELNERLELSVKSSKESIETINLLKTRNKVVEVG
jgi:hypothetical protein